MLLLTPILIVPLLAGLLCLVVRSRRVMAALGVLAFSATLGLGIALVYQVLARGVVTEWGGFLSADALSAWMVLLISVVSLASAIYAVGYLRRDLDDGAVTERRFREFYVLTPLFGASMFLVVLANNLGVMWAAVEATALSSVLLVALYNRRHSLEAAWKYIILGSLGLALALMGTVFVYAAACKNNPQSLPSFNWSYLMSVADQLDPRLLKLAFVFAVHRLRHQGGPCTHAHLAARRAQRGAVAHQRHALGGVAQNCALCLVAVPHSHHRLPRHGLQPTSASGFRFALHVRGDAVHPDSDQHEAVIRLPQRRAYGHYVRGFWSCGPAEHFRRAAAYRVSRPGEIHDLLRRRQHPAEAPFLGTALAGRVAEDDACFFILLALAVIGIAGLPPFGMFLTEFSIVAGGIGAGHILASVLFVGGSGHGLCWPAQPRRSSAAGNGGKGSGRTTNTP